MKNHNQPHEPSAPTLHHSGTPPPIHQSTNPLIHPAGATLPDDLSATLSRFVILPKWAAETLALWVLHTYAFELREVSTYIGIESPEKRCGKTTLLEVLSKLVNRPIVAANISSSAFFRVIEETRPTLLIDEADTFLQGNDELRGVLNTGYRRDTGFVWRVTQQAQKIGGAENVQGYIEAESSPLPPSDEPPPGNTPVVREPKSLATRHSSLVTFSCWCPKAIAAIGRLPDTLADRCIVIRMQRKTADEECERLRSLDGAALRRRCVQFVMEHGDGIGGARPEIPDELNDRAADIWEPLLALADLAGGDWPKKAREAAISFSTNSQERNPLGSLLFDIFVLFSMHQAKKMFTRDLVDGLNGTFTDRPWSELTRIRTVEARQGVTEKWLAQQLRPYGIRPITIRVEERVGRGYLYDEFLDIFRRYVPRSEVEEFRAETKALKAR
jgi:hypothetical protein